MDAVRAYDSEKETQLDQAFEELKRPTTDPHSCIRIAKAYMREGRSPLQRKDENIKGSLIRWLVVESLHTNPSLFGASSNELQTYFAQVLREETARELQKSIQVDSLMSTMQQGEPFAELRVPQREMFFRLKAHKPLVVSMAHAPYGDTILLTPTISDIAKTLKIIGSRSTIRYIVKQAIADLVRSMLRSYENIEVISYNYKLDTTYTLYLSKLAVATKLEAQIDPQEDSFADYAMQAGIIFGWEKWDESIHDIFLKGVAYQWLKGLPLGGVLIESSDKHTTNTSRRSSQRGISQVVGVKIFDTPARDDITAHSEGVQAFIDEYLTASASEGVQAILHELQVTPGFEKGFLCIVSQGSNQIKRITRGLSDLLAQELADFCQGYRMGIVFICSPSKTNTGVDDNAFVASRFLAHSIPTYPFYTTNRIADTLVMLQRARGVIGPDTFLTHAAEYFQDKPVVNFLADSAQRAFRINNRVISVQHPIAKRAEENLRVYIPMHSELYARELVHPFTPLLSKEEQAHFHPLIQEAQDSLIQEVRSGLHEFRQRIIDK